MPEALNNYLLRLGWGHKDKEFFTTMEAIRLFNLKGIGKSPAKFDANKLKVITNRKPPSFWGVFFVASTF